MTEPDPIHLTRNQARRLMLAHLGLWPPRSASGKSGVLEFIRRVGCIQFDPINVVARNPDLVLQARIRDYNPSMLEELLYTERTLIDGWDKMASILLQDDWPYFARHREAMRTRYASRLPEAVSHADAVLQSIRERGPLSPTDFKSATSIDGFWGRPMKLARGALQVLYEVGALGVHSRIGTRRVYDLIENLLPQELLQTPEPNPEDVTYQRWHLVRRTQSMGLVQGRAGVHWSGVLGLDSAGRRRLLDALVEDGYLLRVAVEGLPGRSLFTAAADFEELFPGLGESPPGADALTLLAPLDNLLWDRDLVRLLFDFDYVWEVYKPAAGRKYGYYVLPVLYGDRLIARCEPRMDRRSSVLTLSGWWWEEGVDLEDDLREALISVLVQFASFLGANRIEISSEAGGLQRIGLGEILLEGSSDAAEPPSQVP